MSAIGDYVHYRALNYLKHGITTKGAHLNYQSQKTKIETQLKRQFTTAKKDSNLHQVETLANEMIEIINDRQPRKQKIETVEEYYENFKMLFDDVISDWFKAPYGVNAGYLTWQAGKIKPPKINKMKDLKNLNGTVKYLQYLVRLFTLELADGMVEAEEFLALGKFFLQQLVSLQKELKDFNLETDAELKAAWSNTIDLQWSDLSKFVGVLKELYDAVYEIPFTYITNEMITDRIQQLLPPKAHEQAAEMLAQASRAVCSKTEVHSRTRQDNVTASISRFKNTLFKSITEKDGLIFNLSWTENNLVDFIFTNNQQTLLKHGSLAKIIRYETNIGLLDMLQETKHGNDYITHFLNVFATRLGTVPQIIKNHRLTMKEELKISSLYTLIQHNDLNALKKKKRADIIFQYDGATGKLSAHSIYSILESTYKNIDSLEILMDGKSIDADFRRFPNRFWGDRQVPSYSDASRRIANLLADAHQRKLQISMRI